MKLGISCSEYRLQMSNKKKTNSDITQQLHKQLRLFMFEQRFHTQTPIISKKNISRKHSFLSEEAKGFARILSTLLISKVYQRQFFLVGVINDSFISQTAAKQRRTNNCLTARKTDLRSIKQ